MEKKLFLASKNNKKLKELQRMIPEPWKAYLGADLDSNLKWEESGDTFEANALIKALAVRRLTRFAVLADDSGLVVDALDGKPGVFSARFAGHNADDAANNAHLLDLLKDVPSGKRSGKFVCTLCFLPPDQDTPVFFSGECSGEILMAPVGLGGFGYDPLFSVRGVPGGKTMAELTASEKDRLSHRGKAMNLLLKFLEENFPAP